MKKPLIKGAKFVENKFPFRLRDDKGKLFPEFLAPLVSYFDTVRSCNPNEISIYEALYLIHSGSLKSVIDKLRKATNKTEREKLKQSLPSITVSGTFKNGHGKKNFDKHSGLIQIDFDNVPDPENLKIILCNDPFTFCCFISPSGYGVKAIVKIPIDKHIESFIELGKYYLDKYHLPIDEKCKDIGRLMFLSYDNNLFLNNNSMVYNSTNKDVENIIAQIESKNIDITNSYDNWLKIGFALGDEFKESGRELYHRVSRFYPKYDKTKTDKQFNECLKHRKNGTTIKTFFGIAKVAGLNISPSKHITNYFTNTKQNIETQIEQVYEPVKHTDILNRLLKQVEKVDFRGKAKIKDEKEQVKRKHYLVLCIEEILSIAKRNKWGICRHNEFIYVYNSTYWSYLNNDELQTFLGKAAEKMGIEKFDARLYLFGEQLYKQFLSVAYMPKPEQRKDVVLINLKNGTFEISPKRQVLRQPEPKDFITYQLPFEYSPEAKAALFQSYLDRVQPDKELQNILAEYLAYVFISPTTLKLEKTLLLYGTGANGKSVFFDIVNALLGTENVSSYSLKSLTDETGYFRAMIANKLVNYASEINGNLETSIFKALVSGEPVEARLPYFAPFTLTNYAKLIFNCNDLPKDVEQSNAYFRRFLIVPFNVTIPDFEQDKQIAQKIISTELSGVFNWVLQGLKRLLAQKNFTQSDIVNKQVDQYKKQSDSVQIFLEESEYKPNQNEHELIKDLYIEYRIYCSEDGYKPVNKSNFIKRIESKGIIIEKKNVGNVAFISKVKESF